MADIKISDEQFLSILRENAGLFANTAKAIENQHSICISPTHKCVNIFFLYV